jgi:ABC-2 type transport system permease protein
MSIVGDTMTLFLREMLIFKKNLGINIARSVMFPVIFILLLGSIGNTPKNVPIAIVNYDGQAGSFSFMNMLESGGMLSVVSVTNQQDAMALLAAGKVTAVAVIPSGFSSSASSTIFVYIDDSSATSAQVASSVIGTAAVKFGAKAIPQGAGVTVSTTVAYGATSNTATFTIAGILIMVATSGAIFGGGFTVLSDREMGNLKAFLITPINKVSVLLSKIMYGTMQSAFSAYVALAIGILYGATIASGVVGMLEILWFVFLAGLGFSGLAIVMASRIKQIQTYGLVAQTVTLPLSFLGGALVPVTSLPAFLYPLVVLNPLTYAVNAVRAIMIKGYLPIGTFFIDSLILIVFSVIMIALSAILFKGTNE